ncbi:MAG: hypothetical protein Q9190_004304 [Brigantiaea leucoxantha]
MSYLPPSRLKLKPQGMSMGSNDDFEAEQTSSSTHESQSASSTPTLLGPGHKKAKRLHPSDLRRSILSIKVGKEAEEKEFFVHKELICHYSRFFQTAMTGIWLEAMTGVFKFPSENVEVFAVFENWLYSQVLDLSAQGTSNIPFILSLYVFGEQKQSPGFQNAIIDTLRMVKTCDTVNVILFTSGELQYIYENTMEGSPLRKLASDLFVWIGTMTMLANGILRDAYPKDFLADVLRGFATEIPLPEPSNALSPRVLGQARYFLPDSTKIQQE